MLDKRCLALLNIINAECSGSGYKIFAVDDLISAMPQKFGMDSDGVFECIKNLTERDYLSVKYQDDKEICACPLTKGRLVFENKIEEELEKLRAEKRYFLYSFVGAFIGGVLGLIFTLIVFAVLGRG